MKTTIKTKAGTEVVNTEESLNKSGFVYKSLVAYFDDYLNNHASEDTKSMYLEPCEELYGHSYLSPEGAIEMMEEALMEHLEEGNVRHCTTKIYYDLDFEGLIEA